MAEEKHLTEDRLRVVLNEEFKEYRRDVERFCDQNVQSKLNEHQLAMGHVTKDEKSVIYDARNHMKNNPKEKKSIIVKLGLPVSGAGFVLLVDRLISYFGHKG